MSRNAQKSRTRRALIDAALALSAKQGFSALSIRELTREAGVTPSAFYRHFHQLDDLALVLVDEVGLSLRHLMRDARRSSREEGIQKGMRARNSIEVFMKYIHENANLFRLLLGERSGSSSSFRKAFHTEISRFVGELTEDMEREYVQRGKSPKPAGLCAEAIVAVVFTVGAEALDLPKHKKVQLTERLIQHVRLILLGGNVLSKREKSETLLEKPGVVSDSKRTTNFLN